MKNQAEQGTPEADQPEERQRRDLIRALEPHGLRLLSDLTAMSAPEAAKWLIWNLHENFDALRQLEPTLSARVSGSRLTLRDGPDGGGEKRIGFRCGWKLGLKYPAYQNEQSYPLGDGRIELSIGPPPQPPALAPRQKGYLHTGAAPSADQLCLYGWIGSATWEEIRPLLYSPHPDCHADIVLRDHVLFPVRSGFDFVTGPAGAIGVTAIEIRVSAHPRPNTWVKQ